MDEAHKKVVKGLEEIIARAPDVDVEHEYTQFCEQYEGILWDKEIHIPGIRYRMMLVFDLMRFQMLFMMGADVSSVLHNVLNCAKHMGFDNLVKNFSDEKRMQQMAKILEQKNVSVLCEQQRKERAS